MLWCFLSIKQVEVFVQLIPSNAWGVSTGSTTRLRANPRRWTMHAVASAVVLTSSLTLSDAWALALGRVSVQSHLGQPLRAEIDIPSISNEEAASLQVGAGNPETFRAASMEFNPMVTEMRFVLERRPNGRTVLRISSERAIDEPFLDMIIDVSWSNGRLVRGYTLLLDPPNVKAAATPAPVLPIAPASSIQAAPATAAPTAPVTAPPVPTEPTKSQTSPAQEQVTVRSGDTAGRIALAHKPAQATLEQMLVGLLRANPHAFQKGNVNRMKAGVVLDLPTETAVTEISAAEARRMIVAQSQDFNDYRRRLAAAAPAHDMESPTRSAVGSVQAEVKEPEAAPPVPDKLTLSKGTVETTDSAEAKIASERQKNEAAARQDELNRNLEELKQLEASTATEPATASVPEPAASDTSAPASVSVPAAVPPHEAPKAAPAQPPTTTGPGLLDSLQTALAHPNTLPAAGGLAALLALLLGWRAYQRRKAHSDSLEGDTEPEETADGQSVDTDEAQGPVSSMMYSPSQLDAGGDVDPIAEADVYLAYGRDKQAEEILLEALRLHPERINVRLKLLEIYAQRRDTSAFAAIATEVFQRTEGLGTDWEQARATGYSLDPANPLYQPSAAEPIPLPSADVQLNLETPGPEAQPEVASPPAASFEHFDLELPDEPDAQQPAAVPVPAEAPAPETDSGLDFDLDLTEAAPEPAEAPAHADEPAPSDGLDFELDSTPAATPTTSVPDLDFDLDLTAPAEVSAPAVLPEEIQSISLELDAPAPTESSEEPDFDMLSNLEVNEGDTSGNPLETKLSLAREFEAIGDTEGARSLAEEVEAEATGELQAQARAFLAQLP